MILKINGNIVENKPLMIDSFDITPYLPKSRKERNKLKKLAITLWTVSGSLFIKSNVLAAGTGSMWIQMQPLWQVFQSISMVLGGIAIFIGLLTFIFKRSLGKSIIITAIVVVGGCFLVPSLIMLFAIIGSMMNSVLMDVFQSMNLENSVKVGG